LNETISRRSIRHREGFIGAVSAGCFLILVGLIFVTTSGLFTNVIDFFKNFDVIEVSRTGIFLPAPKNPNTQYAANVYEAVSLFSLIWGFFQIAFLGLRFAFNSPAGKKAENAGNVVFWFGTYYLVNMYLIGMPLILSEAQKSWFSFWAMLISLIGVTLIVRALILAVLPRNP